MRKLINDPPLLARVISEVERELKKEGIPHPGNATVYSCVNNYKQWHEDEIPRNIYEIIQDVKEIVNTTPRKESNPKKLASSNSGEAYATVVEVTPLVESIRQKFWNKTKAPFTASPEGHLQAIKWLRKAKAEDEAALGNRSRGKHSLTFTVESANALSTFTGLSFSLMHLPREVHESTSALESLAKNSNERATEFSSHLSDSLRPNKKTVTRKRKQQEEKLYEYVTQVQQFISKQFEVPSNASDYFKHVAESLGQMDLKVTDLQVNEVPTFLRMPDSKDAIVSFHVSPGTCLADLAKWVKAVVRLSGWWTDYEALAFIMCGKVPVHGITVDVQGTEGAIPDAIALTIHGPATEDEVKAVYGSILQAYQLNPKKITHVQSAILKLVQETPGLSWPKRYQKWLEWCDRDKELPDYKRNPMNYRDLQKEYKRALRNVGWGREASKTDLMVEILKGVLDLQRGFSQQTLPKNPMDAE